MVSYINVDWKFIIFKWNVFQKFADNFLLINQTWKNCNCNIWTSHTRDMQMLILATTTYELEGFKNLFFFHDYKLLRFIRCSLDKVGDFGKDFIIE